MASARAPHRGGGRARGAHRSGARVPARETPDRRGGRVAETLAEEGPAAPLDLVYFGTYLLQQVGGEGWTAWHDGGLCELRQRIEKPAKDRTVEQVALDALALMSVYRYGRLGR